LNVFQKLKNQQVSINSFTFVFEGFSDLLTASPEVVLNMQQHTAKTFSHIQALDIHSLFPNRTHKT
jgi:anthranilate/para-aminobenzoate synthase component I